jgi:hypothetical protein
VKAQGRNGVYWMDAGIVEMIILNEEVTSRIKKVRNQVRKQFNSTSFFEEV